MPQVQPRVATLSDVKASGNAGGTSSSGSWQVRTLNTLSDPTGIVTSLSANQFTLPAGEYYIEASAPAGSSNAHKAKIYNATDLVDALIGSSEQAASTATLSSNSLIKGTISISSTKAFELQHRVAVGTATNGYGFPSSFSVNEVYSIVKITKVK